MVSEERVILRISEVWATRGRLTDVNRLQRWHGWGSVRGSQYQQAHSAAGEAGTDGPKTAAPAQELAALVGFRAESRAKANARVQLRARDPDAGSGRAQTRLRRSNIGTPRCQFGR